jgi:hypothetical protein
VWPARNSLRITAGYAAAGAHIVGLTSETTVTEPVSVRPIPKRGTQISFRRSSLGKLCNGVRLRFRHAVASLGMPSHEQPAQQVPDDHVGLGDIEAIGNGPEEVALVREGNARLQLLSILPILLGVSILALNIFEVAKNPWPFIYTGFHGVFVFALVTISAFIGLFLIVYSIVLLCFERNRSKVLPGSMNDDPRQASWYVKWVVVPLVLGLLASVATLKALEANSEEPQKSCIALYQEAANIYKDNPRFRMPSGDIDEVRCGINKTVLGFE